jgi:hypothetical protein
MGKERKTVSSVSQVARSVLSKTPPSVLKLIPAAVPAAANETINGNALNAPAPVQDEYVTASAKKKSNAKSRQRGGVASTVLSDSLGG